MHGTKAGWSLLVLVLAIVMGMGCAQSQGGIENSANHATLASQGHGFGGEALLGGPLPGDPTVAGLDQDYIVPSQAAGVIEGSSEVTATGEYHYTLPLRLPRGRAGIEPSLSLQYQGRAGDGRLGVGWSLVGLPEIRRCGSTRATEGRTEGVNYSASDRFCLDGKKLVAIRGEYGTDGTEYRTEENSFARIVSYRDAGDSEPGRFRVWAKDGRILDFGGPVRANRIVANRVLAEGLTGQPKSEGLRTVAWTLRMMSDRVGNEMSVTYGQTVDEAPGQGIEYWPDQIGYVRQGAGSEDPRQQRHIAFEYEDRPDPSFEYIGGIRFNRTRRLRDIKSFVADRSIGGYHLDYQISSETGRSLIAKIRRCDAHNVCLSGKTFAWTLYNRGWQDYEAPNPDIRRLQGGDSVANRLLVADLNGDGRDDVAYQVPTNQSFVNQERVRLSEGTNFSGSMQFSSPITNWDLLSSRPVDLDNDGVTELAVFAYNPELNRVGWHLLHPVGNSFQRTGTFIEAGLTTDGVSTVVADFADADGDGKLDLFKTQWVDGSEHRERHVFRLKNVGNDFAEPQDIGLYCTGQTASRVADVTADGRSEWVVSNCSPGTGSLKSLGLSAEGMGTTDTTDMNLAVTGIATDFILADVNGDGLKDAVLIRPGGPDPSNHLRIRWNTGHGFGPETLIPAQDAFYFYFDQEFYPDFDLGMRVADIDGDGREDIIKFVSRLSTRPQTRLFLSRGDHFVSRELVDTNRPGPAARPDSTFGFVGSQLGDVDGDGMMDVVTIADEAEPNGPQPLHILRNTALPVDLMREVQDERADGDAERAYESVSFRDEDGSTNWGPTQHTTDFSCAYPQRCIKRGMPVVKTVDRARFLSGGMAGYMATHYTYADARADVLGRGFLGFGEQTAVDDARGSRTTTRFDHVTRDGTVYPFVGRPAFREETIQVGGNSRTTRMTMSYAINRYDGGLTYAILPQQTKSIVQEGQLVLREDVFEQTWDSFGNEVRRVGRTMGGIFSRAETTMLTGPSYEQEWLVGLPAEKRVAETENSRVVDPSAPLATRTARYAWDNSGQLTRLSIQPESPALQLTVEYAYNQGLVRQVRSFGADNVARTVSIDYDSDDVHPRRITNALGHASWVRTHAGLDVPLVTVDPNGVATRYTHDGFGRVRSERGDDGHGADVDYGGRSSHPGTYETDREVRVAVRGGPRTITQFDPLGQPVFRSVETFDGRSAVMKTEFDQFGRVIEQTRPDFDAVSPHTTRLAYDALDRPTSVVAPDSATVRFAYAGLKTTVTDPAGNAVETLSDPNGRILERVETSGLLRKSFYRHGDFGVLDAVGHSFQPATNFEYDGLGRMTKVIDPDAGTRTFAYNAFGESIADTNALGQVTKYQRDALGRMSARIDAQGRTMYGWDTGAFALGKPVSSATPDGTATGRSYDSAGRPYRSTTTVDGEVYASEQAYDEFGRLARRRYPVLGNTPFDVTFKYTATGYLSSVQSASGTPFFTIEARAADGQLERSRAGNGLASESLYDARTGHVTAKRLLAANGNAIFDANYTYEIRGLVETRAENVSAVSETFGYDVSERLTNYVRRSPGSTAGQTRTVRTDYGYDVLSNLISVTRDGIRTETNEYNAQGRPHALGRMTTPSGTRTFTYDANGRQTEVLSGSSLIDRNIEYTPFDLPSMVHVRGNTQGDAEFRYNAYGQRVLKDYQRSSLVTIDGSYEARRCLGFQCTDPINQIVYIPGEDGAAAQVELDEDGAETGVSYYQKEMLGSVSAVARGSAVNERLFYEPYGQRVTQVGDPLPANVATASSVRRGFTGHDHDDDLVLINMKGRIYDPIQRHFLTSDPFVMHAQGAYALRASVSSSNPLDWLGSGFDPLAPGAFVRDLPVANLLGRVIAADDPPGAPGGVTSGGSDASGYQASAVARASSPSRAGAVTGPPGAAPTGAKAGPNLVASNSGAAALAPSVAASSHWEAYNPYSYTYNSPINYVDSTGYCPICVVAVAAATVIGFGISAPSDTKEAPADLLGMAASLPGVGAVAGGALKGVARAVLPEASPAAVAAGGLAAAGAVGSGKGCSTGCSVAEGVEALAGRLLSGSGGSVTGSLEQLSGMKLGQEKAVEVLREMYKASGRGTGGVQTLADGAKALLSRRVGVNQAILVVSDEGVVRTASATIELTGDLTNPLQAVDIVY